MVALKRTPRLSGCSIWGLRYYNPDQGRWVRRDPIGETGSLAVRSWKAGVLGRHRKHVNRNLTLFVNNHPSSRVDPVGLLVFIPPID
jgi:RHS repeat-associated protein